MALTPADAHAYQSLIVLLLSEERQDEATRLVYHLIESAPTAENYAAIAETATRAFTARSYKLVEAAAGAVVDAILAGFARVTAVKITVHKPHAPIAATFADVGVTIGRRRADNG